MVLNYAYIHTYILKDHENKHRVRGYSDRCRWALLHKADSDEGEIGAAA